MKKPPLHPARDLQSFLLGLSLCCLSSSAQTATSSAPEEEVLKMSTFAVTGTNLKRIDQEKVLPVTVVDQDFIAARNPSAPADLFLALPQVAGLPLNEAAVTGAAARGDNAAISLRGLSSGDTLVLLNGRRVVPHPISPTEALVPALSVNVNQLPIRGLERVEVLRDGASSIYGSDAVAGVVNTLVRRDYRGAEVTLQYGVPEHGGGIEKRVSGAFGLDLASGRGHWVTVFDLFDRGATFARDRFASKDQDHRSRAPAPWDGSVATNLNFFGRSSLSFFGNYTLGSVSPSGSFTAGRPAGIPTAFATATGNTFIVPTVTGGIAFKTSTPSRTGVERDFFINANAFRALKPESTRFNLHNQGEWRLNDNLTVFGELGYFRADSTAYREPDSVSRSADGNVVVPANNPWNPFGTRFFNPTGAPNADGSPRLTGTPAAVRIESKRFADFGQRVADIDTKVYRLVGGIRGTVAHDWEWESAGIYSKATTTDRENHTTRQSLFQNALNQTDPAKAYNPFGSNFAVQNGALVPTTPFVNPSSVLETFQEDFVRHGRTRLASGDLRVGNNRLFVLRGNPVGLSLGAEYRYESFDDTRPPFAGLNPAGSGLDPANNDFLAVSPNPDTDASRNIKAAYAEAVIPLVGDAHPLPLVRSLEASVAVRYEDYNDFGTTTKPKFGLNWKPVRFLMVRASYNKGFRAPNLAQLFTGEFIRTNTTTDSYRSLVTGLPSDGAVARLDRRGGNPGLKPEKSRGKSLGFVLDVPHVKGLSLSADYWQIKTNDVIGVAGGINDDRDRLVAATQRLLAAGTPINSIDLTGLGDPSVVRLPLTPDDRAAFAAFNTGKPASQQRGAVGAIDFLRGTFFNKARQTVRGLDFDATYHVPTTPLGNFSLSTAWSYLIDFDELPQAGAFPINRRWLDGNAKLRGNANLTWRKDAWTVGVNARYIGDYRSSGATTDAATYEALGRPKYIAPGPGPSGAIVYRYVVSSSTTYNAFVSYQLNRDRWGPWLGDTTLRIAVNNVLDENPPLSPDALGFDASVHDAQGRTFFFEITKRF